MLIYTTLYDTSMKSTFERGYIDTPDPELKLSFCIYCVYLFKEHTHYIILHYTHSCYMNAFGHGSLGSGFESLISADNFLIFDITIKWPKTTQIAAILSSDRTYVNMHLRL